MIQPDERVPGETLAPMHYRTRGILGPFTKPTFNEPAWGNAIEMRAHGTKYARSAKAGGCDNHQKQPVTRWKLIIVNPSDKIAVGVGSGAIASERDVPLRFHTINDLDG